MTPLNNLPKQSNNNLQQNNKKQVANNYLSKLNIVKHYLAMDKVVYFLDTHQKLTRVVQSNHFIQPLEVIDLVHRTVNYRKNDKQPLFQKKEDIENCPFAPLLLTYLYKKTIYWKNPNYDWIRKYFPFHQPHVYFICFFKQLFESVELVNKKRHAEKPSEKSAEKPYDCEVLDLFINRIKQETNSTTVKHQQQRIMVASLKNYRNLHLYLEQLSNAYPNFVITYLTLYPLVPQPSEIITLKRHFNTLSQLPPQTVEQTVADYKMAKMAREDFFKGLKKQSIGKFIKGYAWKLNHNLQQGYFYQLLFFLDTTRMSQEEIAKGPQSIRNCWVKTTQNKDVMFEPKLTAYPASDDFQQVLERIISEMTLTDLYLRLQPRDQKDRIYGRGSLSSKKKRSLKKQSKQPSDYWQPL